MNISLCDFTSSPELIAFAAGALSVYGISLLFTLLLCCLCRSSPTAGRDTMRYKPYLNSSRHITDVRS